MRMTTEARGVPRLVIAGMSGDAGKTVVSMALLLALRQRGVTVRAFKKGPDYIDTAWLSCASVAPARNLDTYLMGFDTVASSFQQHAVAEGLNLIEGNRGLFDGFDTSGTHSTAELAKCLRAPVILVLNAAKVTRTAAALVLGCQRFDPELAIAGVVLNRVNGKRHENILRASIEQNCGLRVLGAVPKLDIADLIPERHLGLVTPDEHGTHHLLESKLLEIGVTFDLDGLLEIARDAPACPDKQPISISLPEGTGAKIGVVRDKAFSFYYTENIEMLERSGAAVVPVSALESQALPEDLDALYIGGGFPEMHAAELSANSRFLESLRTAANHGLPIYAECGGLMLLSRAIRWRGSSFPMAAVFDFEVEVLDTAQGHGYAELLVDAPNSFFSPGAVLRGHEFHYSRPLVRRDVPATACAVKRGTGCWQGRDAVLLNNVWASYTHLHALATPQFAAGLISTAQRYKALRVEAEPKARGACPDGLA